MNIDLSKPTQKFRGMNWVYTVASSADANTTYITVVGNPNRETDKDICSCPGFNYRKTCRHLTEARQHLKDNFGD